MTIQLNHMQQVAVEKYYDFIKYPERRKRPWFEISGPAGSGKTFTVKQAMIHAGIDLEKALYMAYVGKATLALRLNGLNAHTIHHLIYDLTNVVDTDENGNIIYKKTGIPKMKKTFVLKDELVGNPQQLVADEAGMIGDNIGKDILSFGVPLLALGDLNQLPPVMDRRMFLETPDVTLNEIMRQEKDSPIIKLSQYAIKGIPIRYGIYGNNECEVIPRSKLSDDHLRQADIVICETNNTRDIINQYIRKNIQGIDSNRISVGDKLICRQNKWGITLGDSISLVNGMIGYVTKVYTEPSSSSVIDIDFRPEFYETDHFKKIGMDANYHFLPYDKRRNVNLMYNDGIAFEFGNAITCHLSQGSQYNHVLVYVERPSNSLYFRQWFYTAITRAMKKLTIVI